MPVQWLRRIVEHHADHEVLECGHTISTRLPGGRPRGAAWSRYCRECAKPEEKRELRTLREP